MIVTPIQKRFADIDMLGHVNNVNLQHYFDVGKDDFFRRVLDLPTHLRGDGPGLITAATQTSYLEQTRWEVQVQVETSIERVGNKSFTMFQRLVDAQTGGVNAQSCSTMVVYDFAAQASVPVPPQWRAALAKEKNKGLLAASGGVLSGGGPAEQR